MECFQLSEKTLLENLRWRNLFCRSNHNQCGKYYLIGTGDNVSEAKAFTALMVQGEWLLLFDLIDYHSSLLLPKIPLIVMENFIDNNKCENNIWLLIMSELCAANIIKKELFVLEQQYYCWNTAIISSLRDSCKECDVNPRKWLNNRQAFLLSCFEIKQRLKWTVTRCMKSGMALGKRDCRSPNILMTK